MRRSPARSVPASSVDTGPLDGPNAPLALRDGHEVLDLDRYIPFLVSAIGNKWSRSSSRIYRETFGVGVTEWRVMAMLAIEPRITAYRICQVIGLDKAAASRALGALEREGYVRSHQDDPALRRKLVELTGAGWEMHGRIIRMAHEREAALVSALSPGEVEQLAGLLVRVLQGVPEIMKAPRRRDAEAPGDPLPEGDPEPDPKPAGETQTR